MRSVVVNNHQHFGNPFTISDDKRAIKVADIPTAVKAYRD